jgi:hypothetical protein
MANTYYQVTLSVRPKSGAAAELVPPPALQEVDYSYVIVKDGGTEGIIRVEASDAQLKKLEADPLCKKLTAKQLESLSKSYPAPKLKKMYRPRPLPDTGDDKPGDPYEVDAKGNRIVATIQTVRSGFYLIDVPVI